MIAEHPTFTLHKFTPKAQPPVYEWGDYQRDVDSMLARLDALHDIQFMAAMFSFGAVLNALDGKGQLR